MNLSQRLIEQRDAHLEAVENFRNNPGGVCNGPKDECFPDAATISAVQALEAERDKLKTKVDEYHRALIKLSCCAYCEGIGELCAEHTPDYDEDDDSECDCCDDCGMTGSDGHCGHCYDDD